jgi:prefoldin alpha subunit
MAEREIDIGQLSVEQLNNLKTSHENELRDLQGQLEQLAGAKNRFITARRSVTEIENTPENTEMLVPLSQSLYVPGILESTDKVIVELGTGYYAEKGMDGARDLIDRKMALVQKSVESIEEVANKKRKNLEQIMQFMQYKIQMMEQGKK